MSLQDAPVAHEGFYATHFLTVKDHRAAAACSGNRDANDAGEYFVDRRRMSCFIEKQN